MFRHTSKLDLETKVHDPVCTYDEVNVETTYMHASSAYGLTGVLAVQLLLLSVALAYSVCDCSSTKCQVG